MVALLFVLSAGVVLSAPPKKSVPEEEVRINMLPWQREPARVVKLAKEYLDALPADKAPADDSARQNAIAGFARSYLIGFMYPATGTGGSPADVAGSQAGQEYRKANPGKMKETMAEYGYVPVEAEGIWVFGFEQSNFKPRGPHAKEHWWISVADATFDRAGANDSKGIAVRLTGYLSPAGLFGHMGSGDHEFYATKITRVAGK